MATSRALLPAEGYLWLGMAGAEDLTYCENVFLGSWRN